MDIIAVIGAASIIAAGLCIGLGGLGSCLGEGNATASGLQAIAQQPDEAGTISRTMFIGLAIIETGAIYCFVVTMILLFANPFWNYVIENAANK